MIEKLQNFNIQLPIVVMSDFIIDRIIKLNSKQDLFNMINNKSKFGAGAIRGIQTYENKGGKAVNVAYCLAKLGAKQVTLFTIADKVGLAILEHFFSDFGGRVNLQIKNGKQGYSTAFEFLDETDKVFLSDVGDNDKFGPNLINCKDDIKILKDAAAVALVDWASNSFGTELAEYVFKKSSKSLHFIDTGDIQDRKKDIPKLLQVLADTTNSILSINENECNSFAEVINFNSLNAIEKGEDATIEENIQRYLKMFAKKIKVSSIDLHANKFTAWSDGKDAAFVPTRKVKINNLVGAGDSWDAANIVGYLAGLDAKERLTFSNAYVSLYISNPNSEPANMNEVIDLLKI